MIVASLPPVAKLNLKIHCMSWLRIPVKLGNDTKGSSVVHPRRSRGRII